MAWFLLGRCLSADVYDYFNLEVNDSRVYLSKDALKKNHVITHIDNGLGAVTDITYKPLTDSNVYTKGEDAAEMNFGEGSPVFDIISPMYVVSEAESTSPGVTGSTAGSFNTAATAKVRYQYRGARMQSGGRGFLGFEALATLDPQNGVESITTYLQQFPFTGRPSASITRLATTGAWIDDTAICIECLPPPCNHAVAGSCVLDESYHTDLLPELSAVGSTQKATTSQKTDNSTSSTGLELSRSVNDWLTKTLSGGSQFPYLQTATDVSRTPSQNLSTTVPSSYAGKSVTTISTTTTTSTYDDYANPTLITVVTKDASGITLQTKSTSNSYGTTTEYKRFGRLTSAAITTTVGGTTKTRNSSFEYESGSLLLKREIIEPSGSVTQKLITDYKRDSYGNITKKSMCSSDVSDCGTTTTQNPSNFNWINRWSETSYELGTYPKTTTNALGQVLQTIVSRNNLGQVTDSFNLFGTHTQSEYDAFGFLTHSWSDTGAEQWFGNRTYSGDYGLKLLQKTVTLGAPSKVSYLDALGRVVRSGVKGFDGIYLLKDTVTDTKGRAILTSQPYKQTSSPAHWTLSEFDVLGRLIKTTQPDSRTNEMFHNGLTLISTIGIGDGAINSGLGLNKTEIKNALGQLERIVDHNNGSIDYVYDLYGKLRFMYSNGKDGNNVSKIYTTEIQHDDLGRKTATLDPDMGTWTYEYNAAGELTRQTDAIGQKTESYYDALGRLQRRVDKNSSGTTVGDSAWTFSPALGYLTDIANSYDSNYLELFEYDDFGRIKKHETFVDGVPYTSFTWFDNASRVSGKANTLDSTGGVTLQDLPIVAHEYNANGYLHRLRNDVDNKIIWEAILTDNFGNVVEYKSENGLYVSTKSFNPETALVESHTTQRAGSTIHQQLSYSWDTLGNLRSRTDLIAGKSETFGYDNLNRLLNSNVPGELSKTYQYDDFGNITSKDGSSYSYNGSCNAGPHAVTSAQGGSYCYDANGNQTSGDGRSLVYSTFGKPTQIIKSSTTVNFNYNPARSRYKKEKRVNGSVQETKITAGGLEVIYNPITNTAEVRSYIADALLTFTYTGSSSTATKSTRYLFKDHLGSTDTILQNMLFSDVVTKMSFSSFGERRLPADWDSPLSSAQLSTLVVISDKGYTGHEQLDDVGLIHMNGRVYDPKLGRFMSADPHIQAPTDTQSLNRYSYVLNNPLSATDPSGYFSLRKWVGTIVAIAGSVACAGTCTHAMFVAIGAASGAAGAAANGGNILKGALIGAFTANLFYEIGQYANSGAATASGGEQTWQVGKTAFVSGTKFAKVVGLHAAAGGVSSVLNGGKFGHGFVSAGFGKSFSHMIAGIGNETGQLVVTMVVAGTASKLVGGKFSNGAGTAAFQYLMNFESSDTEEKLTREELNKMSPYDVVKYWASGKGGRLHFGPDSEMSILFKDGNGAEAFEQFLSDKFNGNPPQGGRVTNFDYKFTWKRAVLATNLAEQVIGSWENGEALVSGSNALFRISNTMGANSLFFGRQLGEMGITPVGDLSSDVHMTITWKTPLKVDK